MIILAEKVCFKIYHFCQLFPFTWEISETPVTFLNINISVQDNNLATSVHYKPTDLHSYLLYSFSHPSHVKDSIPYSQFLRLHRLCSNDSDFNSKCDEMSNFFSERGFPDNILSKALNRVQNVNRESALQPSASQTAKSELLAHSVSPGIWSILHAKRVGYLTTFQTKICTDLQMGYVDNSPAS